MDDIDWSSDKIRDARDVVSKAISDYLTAVRPDEATIVVAWAVGIEWTSIELEQNFQAGRDVIMPREQTISASAGLGAYLVNRFTG